MSDQLTTISSLPAGYPTLAGLLYAVSATLPITWSQIAWAHMSRVPLHRNHADPLRNNRHEPGTAKIIKICHALSKNIASTLRDSRSSLTEESTRKRIAALHLLASYVQLLLQTSESGLDIPLEPFTSTSRSGSNNSTDVFPNDFPSIWVQIYDFEGESTSKLMSLTMDDLKDIVSDNMATESDGNLQMDIPMERVMSRARMPGFKDTVSAQRAALLATFFVELGYKLMEMLFGCAVILGSTGGAWLGLTLGSMFPHRIAAKLFVSSYGQTLPEAERITHPNRKSWRPRPAGEIWTDGPDGYIIAPSGVVSDQWRNFVGYWSQYAIFVIVQYFKFTLREALEFSSYAYTRDAIRYVVMVVEFFGLLICASLIWQRKKNPRSWSIENIVGVAMYGIMLSGGLVSIILGQKAFLKPIGKFFLVSRVVDPIAAIGSVAALRIDRQEGGRVFADIWVLIWLIGACSVVW